MYQQNEAAITFIFKTLFLSFDSHLRLSAHQNNLPKSISASSSLLLSQLLYTIEFPAPSSASIIFQDIDQISSMQRVVCPIIIVQTQSLKSNKQQGHTNQSDKDLKITETVPIISLSKFNQSEAIPLCFIPSFNDEQINFIQKQLYRVRSLRQQQIIKQQQRLIKKNQTKYFKGKTDEIVFDFSGDLLKSQKSFQQPKKTNIITFKQLETVKKQRQQKSMFLKRDSSGEVNMMKTRNRLYGNSNCRQVSHLPYLKLNQNTKITENNSVVVGPLKTQASRSSSFVHFSQRGRYAREDLNNFQTQITQETSQVNKPSSGRLRQSKMIQKYLKKLVIPKEKVFHRTNFLQVSTPSTSPIHSYYKYDFDSHFHK